MKDRDWGNSGMKGSKELKTLQKGLSGQSLDSMLDVLRFKPMFPAGKKFGNVPGTQVDGYAPEGLRKILVDLQGNFDKSPNFGDDTKAKEKFLDSHAVPDFDHLALGVLEAAHYLAGGAAGYAGAYYWEKEDGLRRELTNRYALKTDIEQKSKAFSVPQLRVGLPTKVVLSLATLSTAVSACGTVFGTKTPEISPPTSTPTQEISQTIPLSTETFFQNSLGIVKSVERFSGDPDAAGIISSQAEKADINADTNNIIIVDLQAEKGIGQMVVIISPGPDRNIEQTGDNEFYLALKDEGGGGVDFVKPEDWTGDVKLRFIKLEFPGEGLISIPDGKGGYTAVFLVDIGKNKADFVFNTSGVQIPLTPEATTKVRASLVQPDTPTPETPEEKSSLEITLDDALIDQLNKIETVHRINRYTSSQIINQMGITDPELIDIYKEFFDGNWESGFANTEFRGLGFYSYPAGDKLSLHTAVGLLYGFVPIETVPEQVQTWANSQGVDARPMYVILQIQPGKDLTPEKNPEAFMAIRMGMGLYGKDGLNDTGFALGVIESDKRNNQVVTRTVGNGKTYRGSDAWSIDDMEGAFGLKRGSIILVSGLFTIPERADASWFQLIMNEFPSADIQDQFHFKLGQ